MPSLASPVTIQVRPPTTNLSRGRQRKKQLTALAGLRAHELALAVAANPNTPRYAAEGVVALGTAAFAAYALPRKESILDWSPANAAERTMRLLWLTPWAPLLMIDAMIGIVPGLTGGGSPVRVALETAYGMAYLRAMQRTGAKTWGLNAGEAVAIAGVLGVTPIATAEGLAAVAQAIRGIGEVIPG